MLAVFSAPIRRGRIVDRGFKCAAAVACALAPRVAAAATGSVVTL
jgi:hypothetical protein